MFSKKYIVVSVIKEQNTYEIVNSVRINPIKPLYKGNNIEIKNPSFTKRLKVFFYIDNNGNQLSFGNNKPTNIDTKVIDDILSGKVISELTKNMTGKNIRQKIFDMIFGGLIGGLSTFIASAFIFGGIVI